MVPLTQSEAALAFLSLLALVIRCYRYTESIPTVRHFLKYPEELRKARISL